MRRRRHTILCNGRTQQRTREMPWIIHTKMRKNYHRRRPHSTDDLFTLLWLFVLKQTPSESRCVCPTHRLAAVDTIWWGWTDGGGGDSGVCHRTENEFISIFVCVFFFGMRNASKGTSLSLEIINRQRRIGLRVNLVAAPLRSRLCATLQCPFLFISLCWSYVFGIHC